MAKRIDPLLWETVSATKFKRRYKDLDQQHKDRIDQAIQEMKASPNPASLGKYKKQFGVFSYEIGTKYRIIYHIRYDAKIIDIISVCDHKSVYGRG